MNEHLLFSMFPSIHAFDFGLSSVFTDSSFQSSLVSSTGSIVVLYLHRIFLPKHWGFGLYWNSELVLSRILCQNVIHLFCLHQCIISSFFWLHHQLIQRVRVRSLTIPAERESLRILNDWHFLKLRSREEMGSFEFQNVLKMSVFLSDDRH